MAPVRGVIVCILALPHSTADRQKLDHMRSLFLSAYHSATESMLEHSGISVLTAVGPLFPDAENIPGSFQRVLDMLEFQRYFGAAQGVFSAGKLSALPVWNLHRVSDLDNQCRSQCSLLLSGKQKSFFSSVHKSIQELHVNVPSSLQQFKADCFHYISALIFHLTDRQMVNENAVQNLDIYGMIDRTESESMLFQAIDTLLSELTKTYFQQQQEASFLSASSMRSYIQEHYTDANLTVTGVAEVFQMTQPAFSAHYKRKLGVFPLEDINKCRCQHAYRMLEAGEKDLDKILHASGFNSCATMHRLIKRFYNATPAQLRRSFMARE
jgi:two-component system response regulator YesN